MKNFVSTLTLVICLFLSMSAIAQLGENPNQQKWIDVLNVDWIIIKDLQPKIAQIAHNLNCDPWDDSKPCTDLEDPWEELGGSKKSPREVQVNAMKHLEKAIINGSGKNVLQKKHVVAAQKKYPGYTNKAMRLRFHMYILQMERVFEDE